MIDDWARAWGIPPAAVADLRNRIGALARWEPPTPEATGLTEAVVLQRVRLAAARQGLHLWRNNVGAGYDEAGNFMRWGLANDSKQLNAVIKSGDLIGVRTRVITQDMVGQAFGQFVSLETKRYGWKYTGTPREVAQQNWINHINALGGEARFIADERML